MRKVSLTLPVGRKNASVKKVMTIKMVWIFDIFILPIAIFSSINALVTWALYGTLTWILFWWLLILIKLLLRWSWERVKWFKCNRLKKRIQQVTDDVDANDLMVTFCCEQVAAKVTRNTRVTCLPFSIIYKYLKSRTFNFYIKLSTANCVCVTCCKYFAIEILFFSLFYLTQQLRLVRLTNLDIHWIYKRMTDLYFTYSLLVHFF